ncbi:NAD(P)-dependent dehydrogenase (short-subunit alcohol dehydrogenase family) [Streptosporangium becharense]|uniref:NAD(P)-dependent dehydrogenase (Short-subunit alcohol dehydrogenase family) n=1 Tax=Streptosporangium becharense TaxID=1816182 RepID=A0A7W9MIA4_9ACTN|nr:SDR family oxidoreductase [Streptosporangium becharense]MBB2914016.1 NAD(P)-dependent dehydrogenase (short-subunit alcohol dehydrogenase family) [Streptosporangium becharense]MBB5821323.1 NAD(P)-dependent dehydrogenase (short-subunit alcohol dehydrogenase family) [Streptosporangium becharense]
MSELRFDGRVAIVTGAGHGLGRSHALALAERGAKVVVNDLGGALDGSGASTGPAAEVVALITGNGGEAVASTDDVATPEGAKAIVRTAVDTFGRVDIVVNNAGILRDKSFGKMSVEEFDRVIAVHVRGSFLVSREAFPYLKEQGYGRIVNTSSPAGLFGNFGQANYSTAKMGLVGLTKTLGIEGARAGIKANAIAPVAWTRMTESLLPAEFEVKFTSERVSALVAFLSHETCETSGEVFSVGGGRIARVFVAEGPGWKKDDHTVEDIRDNWEAVMAEQPYLTPTTLGLQASASMKAML